MKMVVTSDFAQICVNDLLPVGAFSTLNLSQLSKIVLDRQCVQYVHKCKGLLVVGSQMRSSGCKGLLMDSETSCGGPACWDMYEKVHVSC
jgi:hypothetical protein